MQEIIKKLSEELKDPEYREAWISNIAMSQLDNEQWYREKHNKVGKYLNNKDKKDIAVLGAEYFLELLCSSPLEIIRNKQYKLVNNEYFIGTKLKIGTIVTVRFIANDTVHFKIPRKSILGICTETEFKEMFKKN